jgi:hypothetical protein
MTVITPAKFKDISRQLPALLPDVSSATTALWWMNQERLQLRWGYTRDHNMGAVHGTL